MIKCIVLLFIAILLIQILKNEKRNKMLLIVVIILILCLHAKNSSIKEGFLFSSGNTCAGLLSGKKENLGNIKDNADFMKLKLGDFWIKSAYNCCAVGNYKDDEVSLCALDNCLKKGVRLLDFNIYNINGNPCVGTSYENSGLMITSSNYLKFFDVIQHLKSNAFSSYKINNNTDPLILFLRMSTKNKYVYNKCFESIKSVFSDRLLGLKYTNQYNSANNILQNISTAPISDLINKVIIIVKDDHNILNTSSLNQITNISTGENNESMLRCLRYNQIGNSNMTNLIDFNKGALTILLPELSIYPDNPNFSISRWQGVQFCCMCYQKNNELLQFYDKFFNDAGYAFVPKPCGLRYRPIYIDTSEIKCKKSLSRQEIQVIAPWGEKTSIS